MENTWIKDWIAENLLNGPHNRLASNFRPAKS